MIDLAIYETLYTLLGPQVIDFDQLGIVQERRGSRLPFTAPRNTYETADGHWVAIGGSSQSVFERICLALGRPDLPDDPRFADNQARLANADALDEELGREVARHDRSALLELLLSAQAAVSSVNNVADTFADPQIAARGNLVPVDDVDLGVIRMQAPLGHLSETPGSVESAGPRLGANSRDVLVDLLGFSPGEVGESNR
jgi:formyl-CoA transferase